MSIYPLPCPVCGSTKICTFEQQEGLFVASCENDDCAFGVQTHGASIKEAIAIWNTRPAPRSEVHSETVERCIGVVRFCGECDCPKMSIDAMRALTTVAQTVLPFLCPCCGSRGTTDGKASTVSSSAIRKTYCIHGLADATICPECLSLPSADREGK